MPHPHSETATTASPPVVLIGPEELGRLRLAAQCSDAPFASAWQHLQEDADAALTDEPTVYDGENSVDLRFAAMHEARKVHDLCFAFHATGDARYAEQARTLFRAWPLHDPLPGSRLSQDDYAGQDRGDTIAGLGLNAGLLATDMASAYGLVWPHLSPDERKATEEWFRLLADLIRQGRQAWIDNDYYGRQHFNNHLSGENMGWVAIGCALGDQALIAYALDSPENPRDWREMHNGAILMEGKANAEQLWEGDPTLTRGAAEPVSGEVYDRYRVLTVRNGRGCGMPYAFFHQKMLTLTAEMAHQNGIDLFGYTGPDGENLRLTFEAYAPHLLKREPLAREGYYATNRVYETHVALYELASRRYRGNVAIQTVLTQLNRVAEDPDRFGWAAVLLYGAADGVP